MRTISVVFFASLLGVAIGFGSAVSALSIHAWNPDLEFVKHSELVKKAARESTNPDAKASIEEREYDFGLRDVKEKGTHNFYIKNIGTAPLKLVVDRTSCTCTGIDLSTKTLAPGKTLTAILRYDAERAMTGSYHQGGTIVTNDPDNYEITLSVKGIFTAPIVQRPTGTFFPNVHAAAGDKTTVRIYGFEKTPLTIDSFDWKDKDHFDLKLTRSELNEEDTMDSLLKHATAVYDVEVVVKSGLPVGIFQERFILKTNYHSEPSYELFVRGQIAGGAVSLSGIGYNKDTGIFRLKQVPRGQKSTNELSVHFSGSSASQANLQIKDVKPDWLKTTLSAPRDLGATASQRRIYTLIIEIPANAPVANFTSTDEESIAIVTLETGLTEVPVLKIPIQFAVLN